MKIKNKIYTGHKTMKTKTKPGKHQKHHFLHAQNYINSVCLLVTIK